MKLKFTSYKTQYFSFLVSIFMFNIHIFGQRVNIPFETINNLIYINVKIAGNDDCLRFMFDTGATASLIDSNTFDKLGLKSTKYQTVYGGSGTKRFPIIEGLKLVIEDSLFVDDTSLLVADLAKLKSRSDIKFDGVIGYDLIKKGKVKVNYDTEILTFYDNNEEISIEGYKSIDFNFYKGIPIPQFDISIKTKNNKILADRILFDNGANLTLLVNKPFDLNNDLAKNAPMKITTSFENLAGSSSSLIFAIKSIDIAGYELNDMPISVSRDDFGVSSFEGYLGILGAEIINKFNFILDYNSLKLYLKPNSNFNKLFDFPLSSIKITVENSHVIIVSIDKNSNAYKAGVRINDIITSINEDKTGNISTYRNHLKKINSKVRMKLIDTNGNQKSVRFLIKRVL